MWLSTCCIEFFNFQNVIFLHFSIDILGNFAKFIHQMLINFTFKNFRSFGGEEGFDMIAGRIREDAASCLSVPDNPKMKLLPAAAIYGANASGKSTLVQALAWLQHAVRRGRFYTTPFLLRKESLLEPTEFCIRMLIDGQIWEYCMRTREADVVEETLTEIKKDKRKVVYQRRPDTGEFCLDKGMSLGKLERQYAEQLGRSLPKEKVLLSTIIELNVPKLTERVAPVHKWLTDTLCPIGANSGRMHLARDLGSSPELYGEALRKADTGITGLHLMSIPMEEAGVPETKLEKFRLSNEKVLYSDFGAVQIMKEKSSLKAYRWAMEHRTHEKERHVVFPFEMESDGTMRYLNLLPMLFSKSDEERVYVIDELDRSLHPTLVEMLVSKHLERTREGVRQQLIFTAHDVQLMEGSLLRRDEIWFVEKKRDGVSHVYPLSEFRYRKELNLRKGYMEGRFGAVPRVLDFETEKL